MMNTRLKQIREFLNKTQMEAIKQKLLERSTFSFTYKGVNRNE